MKMTQKQNNLAGRTALAMALLGASITASAGGIMLYEVATDDVGLASAGYSARAQDASTVLTNPAGMTRLDGTQTLLGAQLLYADIDLSVDRGANQASGGDGGNPVGWFPGASAFITHSLSPNVTVGMGMAGNFGLAEKYDNNWTGRYYAKDVTLVGMSLLPSIAFKVNDKLSLGASLNAMYSILEYKTAVNNIAPGFADGKLRLKDETWGFGANLGMMYEFDPGTRLGVTYTSQVDLDFESKLKLSDIAPGLNALLTARGLKNANTKIDMKVPQTVMASLFTQVNDDWAVLGSVGWQDWSEFGMVSVGIDSNNPKSATANLDFKDTWHVALGAQYRFKPEWLLNFGVAYDSKFQDEPILLVLPANDTWRFGIGAQSLPKNGFSWGVAAEYLYGGTLNVRENPSVPVAIGGRGDLNGSFDNLSSTFISANAKWEF
jgi:long-chain fatty acid transport protein